MPKRYIVLSLFVTLIYFLIRMVGFSWVENFELVTLNLRMNLRGPIAHSDQVQIVGIDDRSLSELYCNEGNPWPWKRSVYAQIIERLDEAGAKSVVMDISFDTYHPDDMEGDRLFAESLFFHPMVTLGTYVMNNQAEFNVLAPAYQKKLAEEMDHLRFRYSFINPDEFALPEFFSPYRMVPPETLFMNSAWAYGSFEVGLPAEDGMYHSIPLVIHERFLNEREEGSLILLPNIDILGLTAYFGLEPGDYLLDFKKHEIRLGDVRAIPVDVNGYFTMNYYGKRSFHETSVVDLLTMPTQEAQALFQDKLVLVGYTARSKGLYDLRPTPFNKNEAGIQLHATLIQNILDENYLQRAPFWVNIVLILGLLLGISVLLHIPHLRLSIALGIGWIGGYGFINYLLFLHNRWLDLFYPVLMMVALLLYNTISRVQKENRERLQTREFFSKYVPAQVVDAILRDPTRLRLGGEKMEVTVLFSDIIGFTTIAEELEGEELVRLLNEYFTEMTAIIKDQYGGTLDKYVGDSIVAIFGAPFSTPDDPIRAVEAGFAMLEKARELEERWRTRGEKTIFAIGVGINTGQAVVGNIGSPDRINYTCIGDTVNLASRLETATRSTGTSILISASTYARVKDLFTCVEIPSLTVKGKKDALTVYSVVARNTQHQNVK